MKCTWKDCNNEASVPQLDKYEQHWANLCDEHHNYLEECLKSLEPKKMLGAWVKASGGAEKLSGKIVGDKE